MPHARSTTSKGAQVSVRLTEAMDEWLERRAGGGSKAEVVRELIEADMAREERERLRAMFDAASEELTEEDRKDRERLLGVFPLEEP